MYVWPCGDHSISMRAKRLWQLNSYEIFEKQIEQIHAQQQQQQQELNVLGRQK